MVHFLIATYLVLALAAVCDDFFVPVLEIICDKLKLKPDVAGATFMAAGKNIKEKKSLSPRRRVIRFYTNSTRK